MPFMMDGIDEHYRSEAEHKREGAGAGITVTFPRAFVQDCLECECDVGEVIRETARTITLRQTHAQRVELRSRAMHYAHGGVDAAPLWMKRSARAVLARLG